jgi:hypothetical protein
LEVLGAEGRIIGLLKFMFRKQDTSVEFLVWLKIGRGGGLY